MTLRRGLCAAVLLACAMGAPGRAQSVPDAPVLSAPSADIPVDDVVLVDQVRGILTDLPTGTRVGLVVADTSGREIVAIDPDGRFVPASNTKIVTTLLAFHRMGDLTQPDRAGATGVRLVEDTASDSGPDVVLVGRGDARLSTADDCKVDCLSTLADAVAARTKRVRAVQADATAFADERWSPGMSWNNMVADYGTAVGPLVVDRNAFAVTITPPARSGERATVTSGGYLSITPRVRATDGGKSDITALRTPGRSDLWLLGTVPAKGDAVTLHLATDNPGYHAVWHLERMLRARGVTIARTGRERRTLPDGTVARPLSPAGDLAQATPPPLLDTIRVINKDSDNLYAEVLLRRVAALDGPASLERGTAAQTAMLTAAGVPRHAFDFSDGSGMSTYNRISPRGMVRLLTWARQQPWFGAWRDTLPVGGVDGTLKNRFVGTPLQRQVHAKTGTLNAANALAGYLVTARGETLVFAAYAGDMPQDQSATPTIDRALLAIAAAR